MHWYLSALKSWHNNSFLSGVTKSDSAYLKRKFQHTGRSRRYRNNLILQFQSEVWIYYSNLCKNVKIIRRKDNLELGWEAEIKLLQPKPVKSDFFFLIRARVHIYLDKVSYWIQHIRYCIDVCTYLDNGTEIYVNPCIIFVYVFERV